MKQTPNHQNNTNHAKLVQKYHCDIKFSHSIFIWIFDIQKKMSFSVIKNLDLWSFQMQQRTTGLGLVVRTHAR